MYPWHYGGNKIGITLNLQTSRGQRLLREHLSKGDIVIEAFTPSAEKKLGVDLVPKLVPKMRETPGKIEKVAALCGQHNGEVYGNLRGLVLKR
jgi:crotonobetainyl-CoA:carnitine CoA-transferase CaiB-like acyl-CoA transferase